MNITKYTELSSDYIDYGKIEIRKFENRSTKEPLSLSRIDTEQQVYELCRTFLLEATFNQRNRFVYLSDSRAFEVDFGIANKPWPWEKTRTLICYKVSEIFAPSIKGLLCEETRIERKVSKQESSSDGLQHARGLSKTRVFLKHSYPLLEKKGQDLFCLPIWDPDAISLSYMRFTRVPSQGDGLLSESILDSIKNLVFERMNQLEEKCKLDIPLSLK